jgi:hypothetical protein
VRAELTSSRVFCTMGMRRNSAGNTASLTEGNIDDSSADAWERVTAGRSRAKAVSQSRPPLRSDGSP